MGERITCILMGGTTRKIAVAGQVFTFEDHPYCGPSVLGKRGEILSRQPMAFLEAATLWYQQGKRVGDNGMCVWEPAPDPLEGCVHLGGKHRMQVPPGRDPEQFKAETLARFAEQNAKRRKR